MRNMRENRENKIQMIVCIICASILVIGLGVWGLVSLFSGEKSQDSEPESESETVISIEQTEALPEILVEELVSDDMDESSADVIAVEDTSEEAVQPDDTVEADDPQFSDENENEDSVGDKTILAAPGAAETGDMTYGIDVAKYQGTINWSKVAASGVQFAMVRVGYRTSQEGKICEDTNAKYNMQEALANGIKIGAYFFSTAVTKEEAIAEADWVADFISKYQVTYPVAYNCEGYDKSDSRQFSLTKEQRTDIAKAFLDEIYKRGYTPMFYAAKSELEQNSCWNTDRLDNSYKMWIAYYPGADYDVSKGPGYSRGYNMWQYTSNGNIDGIKKGVDINIAYFGYLGSSDAKDNTAPEVAKADAEALMNFKEVNETVTAKNKTNLRNIPSQGEDSTVIMTLENPNTATRTGISDSGWSRLVCNDNVCYAVSSFLTTDLSAPAQQEAPKESEGAIKTKFTDCNETITAKQEVNLRTLPSVTNEQSQVVYTLHNGEIAQRTGYNQEYGWSRIEIGGQVLYCVSSYIEVVQ